MIKKLIVLCLVALVCSACAPRGESNSLDQVYSDALKDFQSASKDKLPTTVQADFAFVEKSLSDLSAADFKQPKDLAPKMAKVLVKMSRHSGYTARPSFGELANQYQSLADRKVPTAAVKLLVARTYSLLAQELDSTAFQL